MAKKEREKRRKKRKGVGDRGEIIISNIPRNLRKMPRANGAMSLARPTWPGGSTILDHSQSRGYHHVMGEGRDRENCHQTSSNIISGPISMGNQ